MTAGILSSIPRENLVFVPRRVNGQLRPGERCIATGATTQFTLPSPVGSGPIEVLNNTGAEVIINATDGATISGVGVTTGAAFSGALSVRIPVNGRAILSASGAAWVSTGCVGLFIFSYNGVPLSNNTANPFGASDLFHGLGIIQGNGTWTNPANTAQLTSAASAMEVGTAAQLTDRVASGQNVYTTNAAGSWMGWQLRAPFTCSGFWLQTRAFDSLHPRSFELRANTGTGLATGANITSWTSVQTWTSQTQITGINQYFYFPITNQQIKGNQFAIRSTGVDSGGSNYLIAQEFNFFGIYEG